MKIKKQTIKAYALENAIKYNGKAKESSVLSGLFAEGLEKNQIKDYMPLINEVIQEINSLSIEKQKKEFEKIKENVSKRETRPEGVLPELEAVEIKKVITRIAPSPSGPLHIGHALTGMPSSLYAKKYNGDFYVRIEDTNPRNIDPNAYEQIKEECNWLFGNVKEFIIQSNRLKTYYRYAEKLIESDNCYICDCNPEKFKELLKESKSCPCRKHPTSENKKRWKKMHNKENGYKEGQAVLLFKSNLKDSNPALRDFPLFRIIDSDHPIQKTKYRVWPLMNISVAIDDIEFKTTHAIRGNEHRTNAIKQEMIFKALNKEPPKTYFLGRYKFKDLEISTSKTKELIEKKIYSDWDDIRLPFIASLRKRGFQPQAFVKMAEHRGLNEIDKVLTKEDYFTILSNFNREIIKQKAKTTNFSINKQKGLNELQILMPNNKTKKMYSSIKAEQGEIIYFKKLGYCRLNDNFFWFAHE